MQHHYAGIFPRLGAYIVDGILLYAITLVLGMLPIVNVITTQALYSLSMDLVWLHVGGYVFTLGYYLFFLRKYGATPGKMLFNLKVVMDNGHAVTRSAVLLRYGVEQCLTTAMILSLYFYSRYPVLYHLFIVLMMVLVVWTLVSIYLLVARQDRRVVHDLIAGTVVVVRRDTVGKPRLPKTWTTSSSSF